MEDSGIIDLFFARDERAIRETDGKYGPRLRRYASRLVADEGDGEGCVNDTYLQAWERIPPTRPVVYEAFLFKMLRHICLDRLDYRRAGKRSACLVELSARRGSRGWYDGKAACHVDRCLFAQAKGGGAHHLCAPLFSRPVDCRDRTRGRHW